MQTLAAYVGPTNLLIAAANGSWWDVTVTPVQVATGYASDRWQQTSHNGRLVFVNGVDPPQVFNGTTMTPADFSGSPETFTPSAMWGVNSFKGRVYYWPEKG